MEPATPTYRSVAATLEQERGAGVGLCFWTAARAALIAPALLAVGVPWRTALAGAALASVTISAAAYLFVKNGAEQ